VLRTILLRINQGLKTEMKIKIDKRKVFKIRRAGIFIPRIKMKRKKIKIKKVESGRIRIAIPKIKTAQ